MQVQARQLLPKRGHRLQRVLDALVGDQPAQHHDPGGRGRPWRIEGRRRRLPVPCDGDVLGAHAQRHQLAPRDLADRDVRGALVDAHRDLGLHEPAEPGQSRAEDRPLLAVHVVHQDHHAGAGEQPGQERHAVLYLQDGIQSAEAAEDQQQRCPQVDGEVPATAAVADAFAGLVGRSARIARGEHRDVGPGRPQPTGDLVDVELRTPALRVPEVAPVEDENPVARRSRHVVTSPDATAMAP